MQVGKLLSELLRDGGSQAGRQSAGGSGGEQGRWQAELSRVALELISVSSVFALYLSVLRSLWLLMLLSSVFLVRLITNCSFI